MPFDALPEFPQGREVTSMDSVPGLPPESFQQALRDTGVDLISSTKRPEDFPAVQAAMGAQVENFAQQLGEPSQQPAMQPPAFNPDTAAQAVSQPAPNPFQAPSPSRPADTVADRVQRVMEKYSSPQEIAKAYVHSERARTQAQQQRNQEIAALRTEMEQMKQSFSAGRYADDTEEAVVGPASDLNQVPDDPEEFFKKPKENFARVVDEVVSRRIAQYDEQQGIYAQEMAFEQKRTERAQEIEAFRPIMNELYARRPDFYEDLDKSEALDLLLEQARDRYEAIRASQFYQEMQNATGMAGTPAQQAAPGRGGSLPSGTAAPRRAAGPPATSDWSQTPAFNRLWKTRSESFDEQQTLMDILKERGVGENF